MIDCPNFIKVQKMFCGKSVTTAEVQPIAETQTITIHVNVVDVMFTARSKGN
jgi:hypothetical protein